MCPLKGYTYVNKTNQAAGLSTPSTRVKPPIQRTNHKVNKESRNKENWLIQYKIFGVLVKPKCFFWNLFYMVVKDGQTKKTHQSETMKDICWRIKNMVLSSPCRHMTSFQRLQDVYTESLIRSCVYWGIKKRELQTGNCKCAIMTWPPFK